jgi:hypothetical protein
MKIIYQRRSEEHAKLCADFYTWWNQTFIKWTTAKLSEILLLDQEQDILLQHEIRRFQYEMNIPMWTSNTTRFEIIRFKSMNMVKWLYGEFKIHFKYIFPQNTMQDTIDIFDYSISTAIDCISSLPEIIENDERYNAFVERIIKTLMERLWLFSKITGPIKNQFIAAYKIQNYWRKANSSPSYLLCRKRLQREFLEMEKQISSHQRPVLPKPPSPLVVSSNGISTSLTSTKI